MLKYRNESWNIVIIGLSITSSWGNGHAATYRSLAKGLHALGHKVLFLERNVPWYASHKDLDEFSYARVELYSSIAELKMKFTEHIMEADLVMVGSYVQQGVDVIQWVLQKARNVKAFYDIDTPVTVSRLRAKDFEYIRSDQVPEFDIYFSFTGGPILQVLENEFHAVNAQNLYYSVDPSEFFPERSTQCWDMGYLGTHSSDRQQILEELLFKPARNWPGGSFVIAGPQYPLQTHWPKNMKHLEEVTTDKHRQFYNQQRFTLNITRGYMVSAGYSPSIRLFEAAASGTAIISDYWTGLNTIFEPGKEILIPRSSREVLEYIVEMDDNERFIIGQNARQKILRYHTSEKRAEELIGSVSTLKTMLPQLHVFHSS